MLCEFMNSFRDLLRQKRLLVFAFFVSICIAIIVLGYFELERREKERYRFWSPVERQTKSRILRKQLEEGIITQLSATNEKRLLTDPNCEPNNNLSVVRIISSRDKETE